MKKTKNSTRLTSIKKESKQWKQHQTFQRFIDKLNELPNAADVPQNHAQSAPLAILGMVL